MIDKELKELKSGNYESAGMLINDFSKVQDKKLKFLHDELKLIY